MIHAVIDTNVLVSALLTSKSDTATVQVLEALMNGKIQLLTAHLAQSAYKCKCRIQSGLQVSAVLCRIRLQCSNRN